MICADSAKWKTSPCRSTRLPGRSTTCAGFFGTPLKDRTRFHGYIRPEPVIIDGPFRLGETEVVPFDLPHGRTVTTGLVFRRKGRNVLAYFTDCKEVTKDAAEASRGVDILVVDALRHASHPTHMSLAEATATSQRIGAQMTYFTHMCHDLGHAETESMLPSNIRLAYDGLVLTL